MDAHSKPPKASHRKDQLLVSMSSELRTHLNGLIGMIDLALDTDLTSRQKTYLQAATASAESLLAIVNRALDVSHIEQGQFSLDPIPFSVRDSIGYNMGSLALHTHKQNVELVCHILPGVPDVLIGDPVVLRQIITDVVTNAVKTLDGGMVILRIALGRYEAEKVDLHFSIHASGSCIERQQQMVINALSQTSSGPGDREVQLSLTVASRLVQLMGGEFRIDHTAGEKTTFRFNAHFGMQQTPIARPIPAEATLLRDLPSLIIDNNSTNRQLLHMMLTNWKMKPVAVDNSRSALELIKQAHQDGKPFALILLEANMPEMDGFTLTEQIKQDPRLNGTKIMMLTSSGQRGDGARCRKLGIFAYLKRPMKQSELYDAIMTVLGTSSENAGDPVLVTRHSLRESKRFFRILLCEDNLINQKLTVRILEKRGHLVMVAGNSEELLKTLKQDTFDLALINVRMLQSEGFKLVSAIRDDMKITESNMKIIAMSSQPTKEERKRSIEAGMDAYIAEPLQLNSLLDIFDGLLCPTGEPETEPPDESDENENFDMEKVLARVDGDRVLLADIAELFLKDSPRQLAEIRYAIEQNDAAKLEQTIQAVRVSINNFYPRAIPESASRLEKMGRAGDLTNANEIFAELEKEIEHLRAALTPIAKSGGSGWS